MKKISIVVLSLVLLLSLVSCGGHSTTNTGEQNSNTDTNSQQQEKHEGYYPYLKINDYLGELPTVKKKDDEFITFEDYGGLYEKRVKTYSAYHLITTYEELCSVSPNASESLKELFNDNYVLFMEREYYSFVGEYIGFRNLSLADSSLTITFDRYTYYNGFGNPREHTDRDYILIPKSEIDSDIEAKGTITVLENEIKLYEGEKDIQITDSFPKSQETKIWTFYYKYELTNFCTKYDLDVWTGYRGLGENFAFIIIYTERKETDDRYNGYYNFEFVDDTPTITFSCLKSSLENDECEYKLDLIIIPKDKLNAQSLDGACANVIFEEIEVDFVGE